MAGMDRLHGLHPVVRQMADAAVNWARQNGVNVAVTSGLRSHMQQAQLYARYQECLRRGSVHPSNPDPACRYPANPPGRSAHNFGLAFDSVCPSRYQSWWNEVRRAVGFHVPNSDQIHAEYPDWSKYV